MPLNESLKKTKTPLKPDSNFTIHLVSANGKRGLDKSIKKNKSNLLLPTRIFERE